MAVAFDAVPTADGHSTNASVTNNANLTVGSGSNRALIAFISSHNFPSATSITSVQWDATGTPQAMTLIGSVVTGPEDFTYIYGLVAPTSGNKTLRVNWGAATEEVFLSALSVTGADQTGGTTTFAHVATSSGTSTTASVSITSAAGNLTAAAVTAPQVLSAPTQTQIYVDNGGSVTSGGASRAAGAASVSHAWTLAGSVAWSMVGVDIVAASSGGTTTTKTMTDTVTLSEQVVDWLRRKRDGLDTMTITDDPNRIIQMISDDGMGDLTDGLARALARGRVATETIQLTDGTVYWRRLRRVMDESAVLLDGFVKTIVGSGTVYTKVMSEAVEFADGFVRYLRYRRTTTDNLDLLDAFSKILAGAGITYAKVMSDSVVLLDDAGNRWKYVRSQVSDTLQLLDGSVSGAIRPRTQSDALAFADSLTRWVRLVRQVGDTVEFTDGMVRIRSMVRSYSDSLDITDEAIRSLFFDQLQPTHFILGVGSDPFRFGTRGAPF